MKYEFAKCLFCFSIFSHKQKSNFFSLIVNDIIFKKSDPSLPELLYQSFDRNLQLPLFQLWQKSWKIAMAIRIPFRAITITKRRIGRCLNREGWRRYTIRAACTSAGCNKPLFMTGRFGRNYKNFRIKL